MIFGRKTKLRKVSDLVSQIREKDERIEELESEITRLSDRMRAFFAAEDGTPDDCKRGEWCKACEFHKALHIPHGHWGYDTVYFCGKGDSCPNFVQKEE